MDRLDDACTPHALRREDFRDGPVRAAMAIHVGAACTMACSPEVPLAASGRAFQEICLLI